MADFQRARLSLPIASVAVILLAAGAYADPPLRRVVTDLRISSARVQAALQPPMITELRKNIASVIADEGRRRHGYLEWVPQPANGAAGVPLLLLEVFETPAASSSLCSAKVGWRLVGQIKVEQLPLASGQLDNGCNPRPRFRSASDFESDLTQAVMSLTDDQWAGIQAQFLRFVQLVSSLEANPAKKTVLLPLSEEQLLATGESSLSADFTVNERRGEMTLRPFEPDGTRMGMKLKSLLCPVAISCSSVTDDPDGPWSDSLPSLLANCRGLRVFMVNYVHDLNPRSRARSGILTDLVGETP